MGELIERAIAERLLAAVAPDQITLALTAADAVADRATRATRAVELRVERARYHAAAPNAASTSATPTTGSSRARWSRAGTPNCNDMTLTSQPDGPEIVVTEYSTPMPNPNGNPNARSARIGRR